MRGSVVPCVGPPRTPSDASCTPRNSTWRPSGTADDAPRGVHAADRRPRGGPGDADPPAGAAPFPPRVVARSEQPVGHRGSSARSVVGDHPPPRNANVLPHLQSPEMKIRYLAHLLDPQCASSHKRPHAATGIASEPSVQPSGAVQFNVRQGSHGRLARPIVYLWCANGNKRVDVCGPLLGQQIRERPRAAAARRRGQRPVSHAGLCGTQPGDHWTHRSQRCVIQTICTGFVKNTTPALRPVGPMWEGYDVQIASSATLASTNQKNGRKTQAIRDLRTNTARSIATIQSAVVSYFDSHTITKFDPRSTTRGRGGAECPLRSPCGGDKRCMFFFCCEALQICTFCDPRSMSTGNWTTGPRTDGAVTSPVRCHINHTNTGNSMAAAVAVTLPVLCVGECERRCKDGGSAATYAL